MRFSAIARLQRRVCDGVRGFWSMGPTLAIRVERWRALRVIHQAYGADANQRIARLAGLTAAVNGQPIEACWRLTDEVARMAADGATLEEVTDWLVATDELWKMIDDDTPPRTESRTCQASPN